MNASENLGGLESVANDVYIVRYTAVATVALLVYEYIITFEKERHLVWSSKISPTKVAFLLNRYLPFSSATIGLYALLLNGEAVRCKGILFSATVFNALTFATGEIILLVWIYALWLCKRWMLVLLLAVYLPGVVISIYISVRTTEHASTVLLRPVFENGCVVDSVDRRIWVWTASLLSHEMLMLALTLLKAFISHAEMSACSIFSIMVKDGILYYVCAFAISLVNLLALLLAPTHMCTFFVITQGILHSILCSRLLLRLRGAYEDLTIDGLLSMHVQTPAVPTK